MKKFLKVFIIVLLVLGVIGGTCFFFFRKMEEKNNTTEPLSVMLQSDSKVKFNEDMESMAAWVNSDNTDKRIDLLIKTNENLDQIIYTLATYYIQTETVINDKDISNALDDVNVSRDVLTAMMNEYKIKKESSYFNRHLGANDFYKQACSYLIKYAKLANLLNASLTVDRMADIKFNMFEIYANVVIKTFSETNATTVQNSKVVVTNSSNINVMNNHLVVLLSFVQTNGVDEFSINTNNFNKYYMACDRIAFASNLASNISTVSSSQQDSNEKIATYYFKRIYGI